MAVPVSHALLPLQSSLASRWVLWRRKQWDRAWAPHLPYSYSPTHSSALLPKAGSCPEGKEGVCSRPLAVDSNVYGLTCEAFWMWRQPCYCLWVLVPSARGKSGRRLKSAAAGLCLWYIDIEFKPETSGEMYGYFAVSQDSANWFLALFVWFSLAGY